MGMTTGLETGIELLDKKLDGGLPAGSLTAILARPASQSELLLYELASARTTLYLTTVRAPDNVRSIVTHLVPGSSDVVAATVGHSNPLADVLELAGTLPERSTLVVDPADVLEYSPAPEYWSFLEELRRRLGDRDSVGFVHCLEDDPMPPQRTTTKYVSDVVFRLSTERRGEAIENHLTVPKFRGGNPPDDVIKLSLTTGVDVDVSRNIV